METQGVKAVHCEVIQAVEDAGTINVFVICLDRAEGDHNIIDREFARQFATAVHYAGKKARKDEIDVVVVCSAKKGSFMAGADIPYELKFVGPEGGQRAFADARQLQNLFCVLEALPVPTVALLNGTTLGGGLELALACDYRIADPTQCKQIGLPEVKIGVIPGAGGCCRLPRLIGFRRSLDLLLTGQAINAQRALKLGLVDYLMPDIETLARGEGSKGREKSYDYKWLSSLLACVEQKKVGKRSIQVRSREGIAAVDTTVNEEREMGLLTEEELMSELSGAWEVCEAKAAVKYPTPCGKMRLFLSYLVNTMFYTIALFQLLRQIRFRMPAPYACLQTTFRCLYAGSWMEAMSTNALGFANVATTAETKSLMMLFLVTRKLKKFALTIGLDADATPPGTLNPQDTAVFVLISKAGLKFSSAFIQSLLYADFTVCAVDAGENISEKTVCASVKHHFDYSIKRGHMKLSQVQEKMEQFRFLGSDISKEQKSVEGRKKLCIVINGLFLGEVEGVPEALASQLEGWNTKVVRLTLNPNPQALTHPRMILVNVGDPLRKNTLCVELSPTSTQVPPEDLRMAAAFTSTMGKFPILTSPSYLLRSISHFITVSHWALAASLVEGGRVTPDQVDSCLLSAGFSKGPFATIRELDPAYVAQIIELGVQSHLEVNCAALQQFVTHGRFITRFKHRATWGGRCKILLGMTDLFLLNIITSALLVRKVGQNVSEATIDVLCVSGLVHFPPMEGGPLSYLARVGKTSVLEKLQALVKNPQLHAEVQWLTRKAESLLPAEADKLFVKPQAGSESSSQKSELVVLSASELAQTGPARGAQNLEVFLYPLPMILLCTSWTISIFAVCLIPVIMHVFGLHHGQM